MVCPRCSRQMIQYDKVGNGSMSEMFYNTWEIKVCNFCDIYILEEYVAMRVTREEIEKYQSVISGLKQPSIKIQTIRGGEAE